MNSLLSSTIIIHIWCNTIWITSRHECWINTITINRSCTYGWCSIWIDITIRHFLLICALGQSNMNVLTKENVLLNRSIFSLVDRRRHGSIHRIHTDNGRWYEEDTVKWKIIYIKRARQWPPRIFTSLLVTYKHDTRWTYGHIHSSMNQKQKY